MNPQFQLQLIKRVLKNHQLKYVLRSKLDLSLSLNKNKEEMLDDIDEESADHKFQTRQISFDDYCYIIKDYTKEFSETISKNHAKISKYNLLNLYKVEGTMSHQKYEYLLLQKLSEHIGDMNLDEILLCLNNLKVYDKKVIQFQFELLSERIKELSLQINNQQLLQFIYLFGKFDQGTDELWDELTKLFLFRVNDLSKEEILQSIKGFAGSSRGNDLFWDKVVYSFLSHEFTVEQVDFDIVWILMKLKIQNEDLWEYINQNYSKLLQKCENNPVVFYKFFKYSVQNILLINKVNQIELFDLLVKHKNIYNSHYQMKILKLLAKNQLLTKKIADEFSTQYQNLINYQPYQ